MNYINQIDYTLLGQTITKEKLKELCQTALDRKYYSVCIPPAYVKMTKKILNELKHDIINIYNNDLKICTVIGFPLGYSTTETKIHEVVNAINDGADEVDVVWNIGEFKEGNHDYVVSELSNIKDKAFITRTVVKVIVEICLLDDEEIKEATKLCILAEVDYIKTSTGFVDKTLKNNPPEYINAKLVNAVKIMKKMIEDTESGLKIKASGGIKTREFSDTLLILGADRIGTSSIV